jgi:hypothetical protein
MAPSSRTTGLLRTIMLSCTDIHENITTELEAVYVIFIILIKVRFHILHMSTDLF